MYVVEWFLPNLLRAIICGITMLSIQYCVQFAIIHFVPIFFDEYTYSNTFLPPGDIRRLYFHVLHPFFLAFVFSIVYDKCFILFMNLGLLARGIKLLNLLFIKKV